MVAAVSSAHQQPQALPTSECLLVTACDTGSANAMAPMLMRLSCHYVVFAQAHAAQVFDRWGIPYMLVKQPLWDELPGLGRRVLLEQQPKAVLTGTSWGPTVDKALTLAAQEGGVPCAAVIDHWDLYRERFSIVTDGRIVDLDKFLPDRIWVGDEIASAEAAATGLPINKIEVVGQPHLEYQCERLLTEGIPKRDGTIVFISERVCEDFIPGSSLYRGFDEFQVFEGLMEATDACKPTILIKLHPQESIDKYDHFLGGGRKIEITKDANNAELIMTADKVVGMFSMLLLEAALLRNDVISYLPGGDPSIFIGNRLGATNPATTLDELKFLLELNHAEQGKPELLGTPFASRFLGSADRMLNAVERLMT